MSMKTVKRVFASVRAVINIAITEQGIECINGFAKTYFPEDVNEAKRKPVPIEDKGKSKGSAVGFIKSVGGKATIREQRW
jgi:hypothetical protein